MLMHKISSIVVILLGFFNTVLALNKYNVSVDDLTTCKKFVLRGGYQYINFFELHSLHNKKIQNNEHLHLKFYVMASMDAHILLAANDYPRPNDRVYEIVIGAGANTFSAIRTQIGRRRVATNQDLYLLSMNDPLPLEIIQTKDGDLLVSIPGFKEKPILNYTDKDPLNIKYISFSTFGTAIAHWFYDCRFEGFEDEIEAEEHELSARQRLIENVTAKAADQTMPSNLEIVNLALQLPSASYVDEHSILESRINLYLYWDDPRLQWNPQHFDGIDMLIASEIDIWLPKLVVPNGAHETFKDFKPSHDIQIYANGSILMVMHQASLNTWCSNFNRDWPHERIKCTVILGLLDYNMDTSSQLELVYNKSKRLPPLDEFIGYSDWSFKQLKISSILESSLTDRFANAEGVLQTKAGDLAIEFEIERNSLFYRNIFTMPILASHVLLILSFLLRGYRRGGLILSCFVTISLGLMFLTKHAPPGYVSTIVFAYLCNLCISTYCYLLHILNMWLELFPPKSKPSEWVLRLINFSPLRLLLCMRLADSDDYIDVQRHPWREYAKFVNSFNLLCITIAFVLLDVLILPKI